ncbi:hypothetical protein AB1283_00915 [Bacillus sp. S13(2024)]|uniref:hypothetical protein n=1 Tax=Bacillus sp. S13(2024) TaxID=3162885 RepID=UPI003D20F798
MKIKELKQLIENLDDNIEVITKSDNFELRGAKVEAKVFISNQVKKREKFVDAFDRTEYEKDVFFTTEEGQKTLVIYG